jgi:hypothetical protein
MSGRQVGGIVLAIVATSSLSALVAYRTAARRAHFSATPAAAVSTVSGCIEIQQAAAHTGENACVTARVLRVYTSRSGTTFFDFCQNYKDCPFTSVVFASDRPHFGDLVSLEGRKVEITGEITSYHGQAEIIVRDAQQIRSNE